MGCIAWIMIYSWQKYKHMIHILQVYSLTSFLDGRKHVLFWNNSVRWLAGSPLSAVPPEPYRHSSWRSGWAWLINSDISILSQINDLHQFEGRLHILMLSRFQVPWDAVVWWMTCWCSSPLTPTSPLPTGPSSLLDMLRELVGTSEVEICLTGGYSCDI